MKKKPPRKTPVFLKPQTYRLAFRHLQSSAEQILRKMPKSVMPQNLEKAGFVVAVVTGVLTAAGVAVAVVGIFPQPDDSLWPSKNSRFTCEERPLLSQGGEVWTVVYRKGREGRPWLHIVRAMGGGFDQETRCIEIADRMNVIKDYGLEALKVREDANTPNQLVLCAETTMNPNGCPLVLTLTTDDQLEAEEIMLEVLGPLLLDRDAVLQCSSSEICPPTQRFYISVKRQLNSD